MLKNNIRIKSNIILLSCFLVVLLIFCFGTSFNNTSLNVALADGEVYTISYKVAGETEQDMLPEELNGNPTSYTATDLPLTIKAPVNRVGYTFEGWYVNGNLQALEENAEGTGYILSTDYSGDIILYAVFDTIKYNINYLGLPDGVTTPSKTTYTVEEEVDLTQIKPIIFGYTFVGWFSNSELTQEVLSIQKGTTGNIDLYAKYEERIQTVNFEDDLYSSFTVRYGTNAYGEGGILNDYTPTKDGYTFGGWYTNPNLTVSSYVSDNYVFVGDVTLYAKWIKKADPIWIILSAVFAGITVILFVCWFIFARPRPKD